MKAAVWHGKLDVRVERGELDRAFVITHRLALDKAPEAYRMFRAKRHDCIKVVLQPEATLH